MKRTGTNISWPLGMGCLYDVIFLGWPLGGYPRPQGQYYCGVGESNVKGRAIAEAHLRLCLNAGLSINGMNVEVAPG
jgi:glutamine synthetase